MKWLGTQPIMIGTLDEKTGRPGETLVIQPGDEIPAEWVAELARAKATGNLEFIGSSSPLNPEVVAQHYASKRRPS